MNSPTISAAVIAENEAHILERCLRALAFCDELVVVDGGSTDGSDTIAENCGARVIRHSSADGGIHANKNRAIAAATSDWVLSIDADEVVSSEMAAEILATIRSDSALPAYRVSRRTWFLGRWIRHCGWWPGHVIRLWKRGQTTWPLEVHRIPEANGPCGTLSEPLDHYSYADIADWGRKVLHFSGCEAVEARRRGERMSDGRLIWQLTGAPVLVFARKMIRQSAWRDGLAGLIIAGSAAFATWLRAVRSWEIQALGREPELGGRPGRVLSSATEATPVVGAASTTTTQHKETT